VMKVSYLQTRQHGQSPDLQSQWYSEGYLSVTSNSFEFTPVRLRRAFGTAPYETSISFDHIQAIDLAVAPGVNFGTMKIPQVRILFVDSTVEWLAAHDCLAAEASALLNSFLPARPVRDGGTER
jgi:hypothetical protein